MSRRGILTGAAAIAGMSALPRFLSGHPAGHSGIGHVVVDERLIASASFAAGFPGSRLHAVSALDDLCNRWYTQLRRQVLADATAIAGLTSWMDHLVMRSCAAEIGYRASFHAEHRSATGHVHGVTWIFSPRSI